MTDTAAQPTAPEWWSEEGERKEARTVAARIAGFLTDSRKVPPDLFARLLKAAAELEAYSNAR